MLKAFIFIFLFVYSYASSENIIVQLPWKYQFEFAGFIMAKEKGFYKEAGLKVTLKELQKKSPNIVQWVTQKEGRYGIGTSALFLDGFENKPIELLMPIYRDSLLVLVASNLHIHSLQAITKYPLVIGDFVLKDPGILAMLKSQNIHISQLHIKHKNFYTNISHPAVYALYESNSVYKLKKQNIPYKIFNPKDYGFDFYGDILFTSKKELISHPLRVSKMIEATKKGYIYAFNHINETINIIMKKYNTQYFSKAKYEFEAKILKKDLSKTFKFNRKEIQNIENVYLLLHKIKKIKNDNFIYFDNRLLNSKEKKFIKNHKIRCISVNNWAPFDFMENGKLTGISIDLWKLITKKIGIQSSCKYTTDWTDVLNHIKNNKADITLSTEQTADRNKYAVFSKPYVTFPIVIATRNNVGFIDNISSLKGKLIAVGKNYTAEKLLRKYYPYLELVEVKDINEGLNMLSKGDVYAVVDILPVIVYNINQHQYSNLKIAGKTNLIFNVRFMVRKQYKELIPIINKMIDTIPVSKITQIYQKYSPVIYQKGYSSQYLINILILSITLIIISILWVIYMKKNLNKHKKLKEEFERLATIDRLTGICNRYKIDITLDRQMKIAKRYHRDLSIIFFDIDYFKSINDTYGHKKGDDVLQKLSELVMNNIRATDVFGRWGGEEFLIICPETSLSEAIDLAEKLRILIGSHIFDAEMIEVTCSFGVTTYKADTAQGFIERVDKALYEAKMSGRNKVIAK